MQNIRQLNKEALKIVIRILQLNGFLLREGNRLIEEFGINQQQFVVLNEIMSKREINQKQLASTLLSEKSNISKIIKKLKALKYIAVRKASEDARITLLTITPKGENVALECISRFNEWNTNWIRPLSRDEVTSAMKALDRLSKL